MGTENVGATILSQHETLRSRLRALEEQVRQPVASDAALQSLSEMLSSLVALCSAHFRREEDAGLHLELREASPRLASRLEKLLADHTRLLEQLRELAADCSDASRARAESPPVNERALDVVSALRAHERAENEVMMDAYWDDLGGESG